MPAIEIGRAYRLIGGEEVSVVAVDEAAGIVTVNSASGGESQLTRSAFAGAQALFAGAGRGGRSVLDFNIDAPDLAPPSMPGEREIDAAGEPVVSDLDDAYDASGEFADLEPIYPDPDTRPFDPEPTYDDTAHAAAPGDLPGDWPAGYEDAAAAAEVGAMAMDPADRWVGDHRDAVFDEPADAEDSDEPLEEDYPGLEPDQDSVDTASPRAASSYTPEPSLLEPLAEPAEAVHPQSGVAPDAGAAPTPRGAYPPLAMHETAELPFGEEPLEEAYSAAPSAGLSPLLIGILFGLVLLAGGGIWLVTQSRIATLDERAAELESRLANLETRTEPRGTPAAPATDAVLPALQQRLAELDTRTQEVTARVSGIDETLHAASEAVDARIAALEQRLAARPAPVPIAPAAPSAPSAPTTAARAPTAADAPAQAAPAAPGFVVILASLPTRAQAERELATQRDKGIAATLRESRIDGQTWYRVQVEGYRERAAAAAYVRELATRHGIRNAWVAAAR